MSTDRGPMSPPATNDRLRFAEFSLERLPNGRCRSRVLLTWLETERFTGESEGLASQAGELRCAAQACVNALTQAVQDGMGHGELVEHRFVGRRVGGQVDVAGDLGDLVAVEGGNLAGSGCRPGGWCGLLRRRRGDLR